MTIIISSILAQAQQVTPAVTQQALSFHDFYVDNLRSDFFSAFLSLAGFLFAAKTFILIHMQKELYNTVQYRKRLEETKKHKKSVSLYGPLRRLGSLLYWSVLLCFVTAIAQVTLGFVNHWTASAACVGLAGVTTVVLLLSLFFVWSNLKEWMNSLEDMSPGTPPNSGNG